jgi:hypothetical protein
MNDDIVTRLRQRALYRNNRIAQEIGLAYSDFIENEAADEIERLRAELKAFEDGYLVIQKDRQRLYALAEKALRGE